MISITINYDIKRTGVDKANKFFKYNFHILFPLPYTSPYISEGSSALFTSLHFIDELLDH